MTASSPVAVHMEAPVQSHHPDCLLLARGGHDGMAAHGAPGSKPPVKILKMMRFNFCFCEFLGFHLNAVNLICSVHSEGDPVQALGADHASEAVGMVRLACKGKNEYSSSI